MMILFSSVPFIACLLCFGLPGSKASSKPITNVVHSAGLQGISKLRDTVNALNNNVGRKISINKQFHVGDGTLTCSVRSADIDPYIKCGTQLIPINVRRRGGLVNLTDAAITDIIDELKIETNFEIDATSSLTGSMSIDIPRTVDLVMRRNGELVSRGIVDLKETIKRIDFFYQNSDLVVHGVYNRNAGEASLELLKRLEDMYILQGKYVHVTPKFELVYDKSISPKSNFCVNIQRGKDSITPIIYPLAKKFELLAEKSLTDELKAGLYWSKDNRLFINLSLSLPWGKTGWQTLAFRFVFPDVVKSHVHMINEVSLS